MERGWRDLKQVIDLRPVYHRKEERIDLRGDRAIALQARAPAREPPHWKESSHKTAV